MKRAFSLFELIIVILLLGVIYTIFLPKLDFSQKTTDNLTLSNIKEYLLTFDYNKSLALKCIDSTYECYVSVDGKIKEDILITGLFKQRPDVYSYDKEQNRLEFSRMELDTFEEHEVIFELKFNSNRKSKDLIVETSSSVFVFNALYLKPIKYEYLNDVQDGFENLVTEVKNAF